jgi:hypothetical protein
MITASNLSSPPQKNRETKRERSRAIPENLPWKKTYKKNNCRDAQSRNQKGEWKALGQNQLQRYPSLGIRKVNGKLWDKTNCRGTQV